jgi:hypothetical protein
MAATERTLQGSSPDDGNAEQILRPKLAQIIRSMRPTSTHTHHGMAAVAASPAPC